MAVEAGGVGARLRASREKLGLTVLQVAERIHTDPKIVDAIEAENYEALGAPVYARGHIRHYAELVGESAAELIAVYSESGKVAQPDLTRIVKAPSGLDSNKLVAPALLVIAVFAVAGAVWWVSALSKKKPQLSETHVVGEEAPAAAPESSADATAMQTQPAPSGGAGANAMQGRSGGTAAAPGGAGASGGTAMQSRPGTAVPQGAAPTPARPGGVANSGRTQGQGGATASTPTTAAAQGRSGAATTSTPTTAATQGRSGRATGAPTAAATQARTGRVAGSPPSPAATQVRGGSAAPPPSSGSSASVASAAAPPRSRNQAQVTLHYSADSWTEVYDASGARLFYDVGAANSVQTVVGKPPLRVVLGNASGVAVEFNGHNTSVAKLAQPDGSVQFSINRSGRVVRAKPVADGG
jgi:cytoskeleton protein RodZ